MSSDPSTHRITKMQKDILLAAYERHLVQDFLSLRQTINHRTLAVLVKHGLLSIEKTDSLRWAKNEPRVERIESVEVAKLTEEGERIAKALTKGK